MQRHVIAVMGKTLSKTRDQEHSSAQSTDFAAEKRNPALLAVLSTAWECSGSIDCAAPFVPFV